MEDEHIIPTDAHVDYYRSLQPYQFSSLRRLEFGYNGTDSILTLELEHDTDASQLRLTFAGVTGFEFLPHNFQPVPLYLEVAYIGARQWQSLNYEVFNTEQDVQLSFYCRDFHTEEMPRG